MSYETLHHAYALNVAEEQLKLRGGSARDFIKARDPAFREFDTPAIPDQ